MSYPQPDPNLYVTAQYSLWNLTTQLSSPGDIYESPQSSLAMCLGPDSDIANVNIAYFDSQIQTFMHLTQISPSRALNGQIQARNNDTYLPSQRPGRILFWSADIYDPNFRPPAFNALLDGIEFVAPTLNVIQYFSTPPSLTPQRTDREFVFQYFPSLGGVSYIVVPYYGRKYGFVNFTNGNPTDPNTFGILGVNYAITPNVSVGLAHPYHQVTTIRAPAAVTSGSSVIQTITAKNQGMFDALVFSVTDGGPAPLRIITSDMDQG